MSLNSKQPTEAQLWARDRNPTKWRLNGILANINSIINLQKTLTSRESSTLIEASNLITGVLSNWRYDNSLSKRLFMDKEKS